MRYPAYSNNSSLVRSNLLPRVCIDAAAKPRTYVATSKIQYAQPRGVARWTRIYRRRWVALPGLADATRVTGKRLANAILARIQVKARGYETDFRIKAKRPYGLVARARLRCSMLLACKRDCGETMHESLIYFASTSFRAVTSLYPCAFVLAKPYIEAIMWPDEILSAYFRISFSFLS